MKNKLKFLLLIILSGTLISLSTVVGSNIITIKSANEKNDAVQRMLREINQFRKVSGLKPFTYNESYAQFAQTVTEKNEKNKELKHSAMDVELFPGHVIAKESIGAGYTPEAAIWAYISDNEKTMGHCHSLLMADEAKIGIGISGLYNTVFVSSSSSKMQIAEKVCKQLNQKPLSEVKAYIWNSVSTPIQPSVNYQAYVQKSGWQSYVQNGKIAGTVGKSLSMEALRINLSNLPVSGGVTYVTQVQRYGWQKPVSNNQIAGTTEGLRLEGVRIVLTGEIAKHYDIYYRAQIQRFGWLGWAKNGGAAGSEGKSLRMEALEVKLVKKGEFVQVGGRAFV